MRAGSMIDVNLRVLAYKFQTLTLRVLPGPSSLPLDYRLLLLLLLLLWWLLLLQLLDHDLELILDTA